MKDIYRWAEAKTDLFDVGPGGVLSLRPHVIVGTKAPHEAPRKNYDESRILEAIDETKVLLLPDEWYDFLGTLAAEIDLRMEKARKDRRKTV